MRTEISCGPKGEKLAWFWFSVRIQTVKTWPIDPLGLRNVQLEVTKKSPAESTKCSPLGAVCGTLFGRQSGPRMGPMQQKCLCRRAPNAVPERVPQIASIARPLRRLPTGRDGTGRDGTGRDGTGRDGTGRDGMGRDGTGRDGTGRDGTGRDGTL